MQKITVHFDPEHQVVTKVDGHDFKSLEMIKAILAMAVEELEAQRRVGRTMAIAQAVQQQADLEKEMRKQAFGGNGLILGQG